MGSVHPGEPSVLEAVGVDFVFTAVHHGDVGSVLGRILSLLRHPGVLHDIPGKGFEESGLDGIVDIHIGELIHTDTFRECADCAESVSGFIDCKISALFEDIENFLSIHYLSDFYYKDNTFFRHFQIFGRINNIYTHFII